MGRLNEDVVLEFVMILSSVGVVYYGVKRSDFLLASTGIGLIGLSMDRRRLRRTVHKSQAHNPTTDER